MRPTTGLGDLLRAWCGGSRDATEAAMPPIPGLGELRPRRGVSLDATEAAR